MNFRLEVSFVGGDSISEVTWFRNGKVIKSSEEFQITRSDNQSTLIIPDAYLDDSGTFTMRVTNHEGMAETTCILSVKG